MSDRVVPDTRPRVDLADYVHGVPVRASTWLSVARLAHWVAGRGTVLVPQHAVGLSLPGGSVSTTLRYRAPQSGRAVARVAVVEVAAGTATGPSGSVLVQLDGGTVGAGSPNAIALDSPGGVMTLVSIDSSVTRSTSVADMTLVVTATSGKADSIEVRSVAIYELPRAALESASPDLGVGLDALFPRRTIGETLVDVAALVADLPQRRGTLAAHHSTYGEAVSSGSWTSILAAPIPILPRWSSTGERAVTLQVRALVAGGGLAEVRLVTGIASKTSAALTVTSASEAWAAGTVTVDARCEDPSTIDGLPGGAWETIDVQARVTTATSVVVYGYSIYEAD